VILSPRDRESASARRITPPDIAANQRVPA